MATRLTYTTGARSPELDLAFEQALAEAREREPEPLTHLVAGREVAAGAEFPYGLTAGVFSRDEDELDRFLDEIEAGVVYVNRRAGATTGAWPGVQSFCGWKSSGLTGKGGLGPYYVQQFAREQSRTIVEQ
jgi:delta 1-pyrroline-5-carboxylate dehydrogenase